MLNLKRIIQFKHSTDFLLFLGILFLSIAFSFGISKGGIVVGLMIIGFITGLLIIFLFLLSTRFGFYSVFILSFFIAYIERFSNGMVPIITLEIALILVFFGFLIQQIQSTTHHTNWDYFKNPISITLIVWIIYVHLQILNPNSTGTIGKLIAIRQSWYTLIGFILALNVLKDIKNIRLFFNILLGFSLLAAIYGLTQKYIGLLPYEHDWLYASPVRLRLFVIWGNVRAWSFLNDPSNFGLLMALSAIISFIMILGPYKFINKVILGASGVIMLLAMVSTGTRTAFVMVTVGFGIFGLLTINNLRTVILSISVFLVFLIVYFGPFYSTPVLRIRSAFQGTKDESMNFRTENKKRIQPYILSHPFGGGPNTTGDMGNLRVPGHPLAGFPPDSGYLKLALEMGYIGLCIILWLNYRTASEGVSQYFKTTNSEKKIFYLIIISSLIALCTADLTQLAITMKPFDFIFFSYFAIIIQLRNLK